MNALRKTNWRYPLLLMMLIIMMGFSSYEAGAQSVGISSSAITPDASSILEMRTTTKGLLIPRLTTTERDAISSPATGLMVYNTTTNKFNFYNGSGWIVLFAGTSGVNSVTGTSNRITIGGTAADPTVDISSSYVGQSSITTLGTIGTGVWNGTIITSDYGGTGNGFTKFTGPTTAEKTFTLPNASATILTDNTAVTVGQGGTGVGTLASNGVLYGNGTGAIQALPVNSSGTVQYLSQVSSGTPAWVTPTNGTVTSVSGTSNRITVATGTTTPVIDISSSYVGQSSITTLGTIGTGTWNGSLINPTYGGTGVNNGSNTITLGGNLITSGAFATTLTSTATTNATLPSGTNTLYSTKTGSITSAQLLNSMTDATGTGVAVFGTTPTLATPVINGLPTGTGVASAATASTLVSRDANANTFVNNVNRGYTTTATAAGTTTLTVSGTYFQFFTGTTTQTVVLPVTSTLVLGQQFMIVNNSTGVVTVQSSGANTIQALAAGSSITVTCILTSGTTTASWSWDYMPPATSTNTANTLVLRDASGNFSAGTITGTITGNASTATALATGRTIGMTGDVTWTSPAFDGTGNVTAAATVTKINGTALSGLGTGILKNTTGTGVPSIAIAADFPTLNQNTTGSAATLTTSRNIYGNAFNGSADLSQIIASTYGGTGNGFTKFTGPTTSEKTFTLPNASATILTDNTTITVGQGGTGTATAFTQGSALFAGASGVYSQNNSKFFWDNTNFRLGIGTTSPNSGIQVGALAAGGTDNIIIGGGASPGFMLNTVGTDFGTFHTTAANTVGIGFTSTVTVPSLAVFKVNKTGAATFGTSVATDDNIIIQPYTGGSNLFAGTITSTDLTAARTYTLPNASGTIPVSASGNVALSAGGDISLTGIIGSTNGGTGNGFTKFTGATTSEKTYTLPDASTTILTKNYTGALATGIVKNTTSTGDLTIAVPADFPTLNQNTTGSAATLTTSRSIHGGSFNGSADVTNIIASTYGGTGNGFTKFTGPATAEKTFTLPNASATVLTDNAAVTVAQGGTGVASTTAYGVVTGGTTSTGALQNAGTGTTGQVLTSNGSSALPTWQPVSGTLITVRFITSGTSYTPSAGTKSILIEMVGAGGGGGGADVKGSAGAGGGAGGYIKTYVTGISDASSYTIAIGGSGGGGANTGGNGSTGGATTFATLAGSTPASTTFTCNGGAGGTGSADGSTKIALAGGAGGTSTNGDISAGGAPGGWSLSRGNAEGISTGAGGSSQFGGGGVGIVSLFGTTDVTGNAGSGKGAGGGGAYAGSNTGAVGGAGSGGIIVIYEYR